MKRLCRAAILLVLVAGMAPIAVASQRLVLYEYFANTG
jgi:hypothetical protein